MGGATSAVEPRAPAGGQRRRPAGPPRGKIGEAAPAAPYVVHGGARRRAPRQRSGRLRSWHPAQAGLRRAAGPRGILRRAARQPFGVESTLPQPRQPQNLGRGGLRLAWGDQRRTRAWPRALERGVILAGRGVAGRLNRLRAGGAGVIAGRQQLRSRYRGLPPQTRRLRQARPPAPSTLPRLGFGTQAEVPGILRPLARHGGARLMRRGYGAGEAQLARAQLATPVGAADGHRGGPRAWRGAGFALQVRRDVLHGLERGSAGCGWLLTSAVESQATGSNPRRPRPRGCCGAQRPSQICWGFRRLRCGVGQVPRRHLSLPAFGGSARDAPRRSAACRAMTISCGAHSATIQPMKKISPVKLIIDEPTRRQRTSHSVRSMA